ncbi:MAG: glycosyltransferase [Pseudomonadota bacterium]
MAAGSKTRAEVEASGLFDGDWYLREYPDVAQLDMDPLDHFLWLGVRLGRNPGPKFDAAAYLARYQDVAGSNYNPLLHYIRYGKPEGRKIQAIQIRGAAPVPVPAAEAALGRQRIAGRLEWKAGRKTVLLCAHVVGRELYGSERSLLDMLDGIAELGCNIIVTVPSDRNRTYIEMLRARACAVIVLPYGWWKDGIPVDEPAVAAFAGIIAEERVDLVHVNTIVLREPLIAARRIGVPAIVHARELISQDADLLKMIGTPAEAIIDDIWETCDTLIANSRATADCFTGPGRDPVIVYNTADMDSLAAVPAPAPDGPLRVGLISSNAPKKGLEDFVTIAQAVARIRPEIEFLLIGPKNAHTVSIEQGLAAGTLPATLSVAGYRETPAQAIGELDVVLSISQFQESFGRTVLEAMAAGRPAIVYDHGAPPEMVEEGRTGHVVPFGDTDAVAERICALAEDRKALLMMGARARDRAVERFGRAAYNGAMKAAYARYLDPDHSHAPAPLTLPARALPEAIPRTQLKVAYFCWHFPVPSETFVLNELRLLRAQGIDVTVFCKQSPYPDFKPDFDITWERVRDKDHLAQRLTETGRDIVHAHFVFPTVTDMVWPACEKVGIPFTCIAHAQDIFRYKNATLNRIDEFSRSPWCRQIFTLSRFHRQYLIDRGVAPEKITINSNCVDPELFQGGKIPDRPARKARAVCSVARFADKKGLEHLVRAGKLLERDGITVNIYGYGDMEPEYRRIIAAEKITNVNIHGPVQGREALMEVMRAHDLFVVPSVRAADGDMDGIPTTLMESMAAGLPVLATPIAGIPDLVQDGVTGFICEAAPEDIARRIRDFYILPDVAITALIEDAEAHMRRNHHGGNLVNTLLRFWAGETIDLMIVSWNNLPQTREVIRRLYEFTALPFHLIICDNGSGPEALAHHLEVYAREGNFTLVLNRENAYVGPGTNICMDQGRSDYAIYVCGKEGMTTRHGWEKDFVNYMDAHPRVGQAGTFCYSPSYLFGRDYPEGVKLFDKFRNTQFALDNPDRPFRHVQGGFFAIRREAYEAVGGFSDAVPHSYTDVEYSYYMESTGWELGQVPGLMALFEKTRPGLESRVDETHGALHPPDLSDLPWLDRIARQEVCHCNVCGQQSEAFEGPDAEARCPQCGADRRSRSLHRAFAESLLLYRRLPALGVGLPVPLQEFWTFQFQGPMLDADAFTDMLAKGKKLPNRPGSMELACLNGVLDGSAHTSAALDEVLRLLKPGAPVYVTGAGAPKAQRRLMEGAGLVHDRQIRYVSVVSRYDWAEIGLYHTPKH